MLAANARALALPCLITASLAGCDRAPAVVQHPTGPNRAPADASPIVADSAPTGLSADRLAAWTAARRTLADAKVVYRLGALEGDGPEVFGRIADVALDGENKLLVLDEHSQRVSVFGPSGQFLERFGRSGDGPEELRGAYGIAFEPSGDLLVVGTGRQIKVFGRTASGWQHRETRPLPLAGGMACVTNSGRTIVAGADTRSDRNVLLHEVPGGVGGQVRSFGLGYVDPSPFIRFMLANLGPIACVEHEGAEFVVHAFPLLDFVRLMSVADGSVVWTARLSDYRQMAMEGTGATLTQTSTADWDAVVRILPYLDSHVLLQVERYKAMGPEDAMPESTVDTYLLDLPTGRGARVSTNLAQVMEVQGNRYVVVSTDPYPQIEVYAMDDERLAASSSISPRRPIASTPPPLG